MEKKQNFLLMLLKGIDIVRLIIVNLFFFTSLFVLLVILVVFSAKTEDTKTIEYGTILEIAPKGVIVEQVDDYEWIEQMFLKESGASRLSDIILAIKEATTDEKIEGLYIDLSSLTGLSSAHLSEFKEALEAFKESKKPIWAHSTSYSLQDYYIASFAQRLGIDPMGEVDLTGFSSESLYFKGMEEKFGVKFQTFQAGECKGGVETFSRKGMSDEVRENLFNMLTDMWATYLKDVSKNIKKNKDDLILFAQKPYELMIKYGGDDAEMAKEEGLVHDIILEEEFRKKMREELSNEDESLEFASYEDYVKSLKQTEASNKIGIIHLSGAITSSKSNTPNADIASASDLVELFDKAAQDDDVKAIVLRIDSGGGEVFASEVIRRALQEAREKYNKPVVVSMGAVAASGAYWISSSSDYIFATPFTITGSIGVFAVLPNFHSLLEDKLGITSDSVGVLEGENTNSIKPLSESEIKKMSLSIDATYNTFIDTVCDGRSMDEEDLRKIAGGRVYSGLQAKSLSLVDEIGNLQDAINKAAQLADIEDFSIIEIREELNTVNKMMNSILEDEISYKNIQTLKSIYELLSLNSKAGMYVYTPYRLMWNK